MAVLRALPTLFVAGVITGCGRFVDDTATVCLTASVDDPPLQIEAGEPLTLFATGYGGCHMKDLEVSCEAIVDGDRIEVTTVTTWVRTEWFAVGCEEVLLLTTATCETPPLAAGSYTVSYVDSALSFAVPGPVEGCLEGLPR